MPHSTPMTRKRERSSNNNARGIIFFTKYFINYWCGEWLLINEKIILIVGLDENRLEIGHINVL